MPAGVHGILPPTAQDIYLLCPSSALGKQLDSKRCCCTPFPASDSCRLPHGSAPACRQWSTSASTTRRCIPRWWRRWRRTTARARCWRPACWRRTRSWRRCRRSCWWVFVCVGAGVVVVCVCVSEGGGGVGAAAARPPHVRGALTAPAGCAEQGSGRLCLPSI